MVCISPFGTIFKGLCDPFFLSGVLVMGYLAGGRCHETIDQAKSVLFNHGPFVTSTCPDPYFLSANGGWHFTSLTCGSISIPAVAFPDCEYDPFDIAFDPSFWIPLFWAVGISAAFLLFKRVVV